MAANYHSQAMSVESYFYSFNGVAVGLGSIIVSYRDGCHMGNTWLEHYAWQMNGNIRKMTAFFQGDSL